jgi:CDP-diacylglycerol--glycerol-3-phosphate 3-phosphatidyltransferase
MIIDNDVGGQKTLRRLRAEWAWYVAASLAFLAAAFVVLRGDWGGRYAWRWLLLSLGLVGYQFFFLWQHLGNNRPAGSAELFPSLGLANWMTMARSVFTAALAGFLMGPRPTGWLVWAPSILYLVSALMDFGDGIAARLTRRETLLGEALDMKWDGASLFLAVTLAVLYGQAPVPYLLVGLARYLYLSGIWLRERRGLPVYDLQPSRIRRPFAGAQMGFAAVMLMPVYGPPATHVAATLYMTPFLINFLRDWLTVSGQIRRPAARDAASPPGSRLRIEEILPLVVRVILIILLADLLLYQLRLETPSPGILLVIAPALLALVLGAAGRLFSFGVLLMTGFGLQAAPLEWRYWVILLFSMTLMLVGTGRYSLWKPEDWLIYKRAGERPSIARQ